MPLITKPTRITPSSATLIDHIYTNDILFILYITQKKRSFSDKNMSKFNNYLDQIGFSHIMKTQCPNEAYNKFIHIHREAFDQAFPLISTKILKRSINLIKNKSETNSLRKS